MKRVLFIVNLLLIVAAVVSTPWLIRYERDRTKRSRPDTDPPEIIRLSTTPSDAAASETAARDFATPIWTRNLFHPERSEQLVYSTGPGKNPVGAKGVSFELVSIAVIGKESCAGIILYEKSRTARKVYRGGSKRRATLRRKKQISAHVYKLNDQIEETGWKLTAISIDAVILSRPDREDITLTMDTEDSESKERRKQAQVAQSTKVKRAKAVATKTARTRPSRTRTRPKAAPPPPPPPAPSFPKVTPQTPKILHGTKRSPAPKSNKKY